MTFSRVQLRFSKQGDLRFLGHRDILRTFTRLFRRAGLKQRMTNGYHPRAKMSFPLALAVGIAGTDEVVEIEIEGETTEKEILEAIGRECPTGLDFHSVIFLPPGEKNTPVKTVSLDMPIPESRREELEIRIAELMEQSSHLVQRQGRKKPIDMRPLLEEVTLLEGTLAVKLRISQEVSIRPRELLAALGADDLELEGCLLVRRRVELGTKSSNKQAKASEV